MNLKEYQQLRAEKTTLERLLAKIPAGREIEKLGFEQRLQEVVEVLGGIEAPTRTPVQTRLTFRGRAVVGSYGLFAKFGGEVVGAFSEAVAAVGASQARPLGSRGVLPSQDDFRLMITGTAQGSFGFQLEEAPRDSQMLFPPDPPLEPAIEQVKQIISTTLGTDDELTEALADTDPRALESIRKFLDVLAKNESICAMEFQGDVFRFKDVAQVRRSLERLHTDNIHEGEVVLVGAFLGALPKHRRFEFQPTDSEEYISGGIQKELESVSEINSLVGDPMEIRVHTRRVGTGNPNYTLLGYSPHSLDLPDEGPSVDD